MYHCFIIMAAYSYKYLAVFVTLELKRMRIHCDRLLRITVSCPSIPLRRCATAYNQSTATSIIIVIVHMYTLHITDKTFNSVQYTDHSH